MRKQIINQDNQKASPEEDQNWLDVEHLAQVELTSEDPGHPIEAALIIDKGPGWRAQHPGAQTIRLLFDKPQKIGRIQLVFDEQAHERTQEFVLRWSPDGGDSYQEIVRQQYHFSPPNTTRELEDLVVDLDGMTILELSIIPNISGGEQHASLTQLRLA